MGGPGSGRRPVYADRVRANVTAEHARQIQREQALTGRTTSEIVRAALDAYFKPRRKGSRKW